MKKILSLFLAILMILPLSAVAFAADGTITPGTNKTVLIYSDFTEKVFTFKPSADGIYLIKTSVTGSCDATVDVLVDGFCYFNVFAGYFDDGMSDKNNSGYFVAQKGEEYSFYVNGYSFDAPDPVTLTFSVTKYNAANAVVGKNKCGTAQETVFTFIPEKDGYYNFRSSDIKNDPSIEVYNYFGMIDYNDDIGYADDYNFDLTVYLNAGVLYMLKINNYDFEDAPLKAFNFTVSFNKKIVADYIVTEADDSIIELAKKEEYFGWAWTTPTGAQYTSNFSASSDNENVASVTIDSETGEYVITAHKAGTATITISAENGVSDQLEVKVLSGIAAFFRNLINFIKRIFGLDY